MLRFKLAQPKGVFTLAVAKNADRIVAQAAQSAQVQALVEYATGILPGASPLEKFKPGAFGRFGFSARSDAYQRQQRKRLGDVMPFVSPRIGANFAKAALALAKGSTGAAIAALRDLAKQTGPHLRSVITKPGIGWRVQATGTARRLAVRITWPAASKLNYRPQFAAEFRDLRRGGHFRRIQSRAAALFPIHLEARLKAAA